MHNIEQHIELVKSQIGFHQRMALRYADEPSRSRIHKETAAKFAALEDDLEILKASPAAFSGPTDTPVVRLSLGWEEIRNLPDDLMSELSISDSDKSDFNIVSLINEAGGIASLDRLLVALYRQTGEIMKRVNLNARIYRMVQKELIYSVPGKKGIYSTRPISESDAAKLI